MSFHKALACENRRPVASFLEMYGMGCTHISVHAKASFSRTTKTTPFR
jgi:hypothetical protein